ncbi:MAG: methyltransferase domain-containing protein [Methylovirgula sp.]
MAQNSFLIFDRALQRRRLARALAARPADFLLARAAGEIVERLSAVTRRFSAIADIGTPLPLLAEALATAYPAARITRLAPLAQTAGLGGAAGDAELLPFASNTFDLAVSALALQDVNDLPGTLAQIRRTLKPDGLFLGCLIGGASLRELRAALAEAESEISGGVSPRIAPFADLRDMGGLLQRAGFALPVTDVETLTVRYPHLFALLADLRAMGATNALVERLRRPARRALFLRAAEIYARENADDDGRLRATFEIVFLSGWAPHESQQKPLKPGSGQISLAEVLRRR